MGIWNGPAARMASSRFGALITPHGDLEPFVERFIGTISRLITPHGDLEHPRGGGGPGRTDAHYPSWGFGTLLVDNVGRDLTQCSLPLMGIWNLGRHLQREHSRLLITPHGDLELLRVARRDLDFIILITPHGDLEPEIAAALGRSPQTSLPLMGIWNSLVTRTASDLRFSLPLMGIWNPSEGGVAADAAILITPHGDLELPSKYSPAHGIEAHYPSWGFGTCALRMSRTVSSAHYPSWGFGTSASPFVPRLQSRLITPHGDLEPSACLIRSAASLSSLPLMGIWNLFDVPRHADEPDLITPHGDLERACARSASRSRVSAHYPSWGFGTRAGD